MEQPRVDLELGADLELGILPFSAVEYDELCTQLFTKSRVNTI